MSGVRSASDRIAGRVPRLAAPGNDEIHLENACVNSELEFLTSEVPHVRNCYWPDGPDAPSFMEAMSRIYPVFGRVFGRDGAARTAGASIFTDGDALDLGVGHYAQPDARVVEAAIESLRQGKTRYTRVDELSRVLAHRYAVEDGVTLDPQRSFVPTAGARAAIALVFSALIRPGDAVVIGDPEYIGFTHMAATLGARILRPRSRRARGGRLVPDVDAIADAIRKGARIFAFTNPGNPSGHIWSASEIAYLLDAARRTGTWLIADEVYDKLIFHGSPHVSLARFVDQDRVVVINGTAKNYDITGFGFGWVLTDHRLAAVLADWQFMTHSAAPDAPSQYAALAALSDPVRDEHPARARAALLANAVMLRDALASEAGVVCPMPLAGQFAFPRVGEDDDIALAVRLRSEARVCVVPGGIWGSAGGGHLRIALANPPDLMREGIQRLVHGLRTCRSAFGASATS